MDWQVDFYEWFAQYDGTQKLLAVEPTLNESLRSQLLALPEHVEQKSDCSPTLKVEFNRMKLSTPCPGKVHVLKFNYHPSWRASTGDEFFAVSPGYLAFIPTASEVNLEFGFRDLWQWANLISLSTAGLLCLLRLFRR